MNKHILLSILLVLGIGSIKAQTELPCNSPVFTTSLTNPEYIIPEGAAEIYMEIIGGDGGDSYLNGSTCDVRTRGGGGATVKATFEVGNADNQLQAGGRLRVYVGQAGESENTGCSPIPVGVYGAGGGASGILYLPPSRPESEGWSILMVAGAGGGGARGSTIRVGLGGNERTDGDDISNASGGTVENCPENGGGSGLGNPGYGGGSLVCESQDTPEQGQKINDGGLILSLGNEKRIVITGAGSTAPENTGGELNNQPKGGDGITGGGVSSGGGGGGGGFNGGAASTDRQGGGGGSFLSEYYLSYNSILLNGPDGGGMESSGEALISVNAALFAPDIVCKDTEVSKNQNGAYILTPDMIDGGTTANCDQAITLTFPNDETSLTLDCSELTQQVTLVATTNPNLSSSCVATVTLLDEMPPSISCQDTTLYLQQDGTINLMQSQVLVSATDDCDLASVELSRSQFTCSDIGTQSVILTATDEAGNKNTCIANVTVLDTIPPVYNQNVADTLFFDCGGSLINQPSATDNCSGNIEGATNDPFTYSAPGTYTVTWEYEDASGNVTTSTQTVIVESGVLHVDVDATGLETGESWQDAYPTLQQALNQAAICGGSAEIWVAEGTYIPTERVVGLVSLGDPARERVFYINQDGVKLYGGFSGQETSREQRNPDLYPTILDGNRGDVNLITDNCYRVLYLDGTTANGVLTAATVIDGFTIQNGNADFFGANGGAGMYIEGNASQTATAPLINNCKFANNNVSFAGAGIYLAGFNGNCSPTISDCVFESNTSDLFGAAIHFDAADGRTAPSIEACIFKQNTATLGGGAINIGGFGMSDLTTQIVNCVFDQNGASHIRYSEGTMNQQPTFTNCTFNGASTQAIDISVYENSNSPIHFLNCIFWNNNALTDDDTAIAPQNCIVGNDTNNTFAGSDGNINQNPLFVDAANGDLSLQASSPAVESGTNSAVSGIASDIEGNARIIGCSVDMGTYEFQNPQTIPSIIYVDQNVIGSNKDGTSWANAFTDLQDAIDAFSTNCNTEIWVAQGIYKPTKDNPASSNNTARDVSFYIDTDSIRIYGGFQGVETIRSERDATVYMTILSGDLNGDDAANLSGNALSDDASRSDNAYTIFYFDGTTAKGSITAATVVDGFTIEGGNANISTSLSSVALGGAIYNDGNNGQSSPTISACSFARNNALRGGAIYNNGENGQSNPIISACSFDNNQATDGGAIYNGGNFGISNPVISNCIFTSNTVIDQGGAIYSNGQGGESSPVINSCRFTNNSVSFSGGALYFFGDGGNIQAQITNCIFQNNGANHISYDDGNANQAPHFVNCTFEGANTEAIGIRFFDDGQSPIDFTNCIFWNNDAIVGGPNFGDNDDVFNNIHLQNCIVGDDTGSNYAGTNGNFNQDPLFVDAANGDLSLQVCSPAIDAGDNVAIDTFSTDFAGNTRIINGTVDIGAYERQNLTLPDLLDIVSIQASDSLFTGADTIQTIGTVTVAAMDTIIFEGAEAVVLKAGFSAVAGSDFTARIGQCGVPADNNIFNESVVEQRSEPQNAIVPFNKIFTNKKTSLIAYPNPFSYQTTIEFELSQTSRVYLAIYDLQGRTVANLYANTFLDRGIHQVPFQATDLEAGLYLIRLQTDEQLQTFKLIVQE